MIAPHHPAQTTPDSTADGNAHAALLRRQRYFQQDTQVGNSAAPRVTSILVPAENGEELEPLVCRMD